MQLPPRESDDDEDEDAPQDIQEVWFPGNHAVGILQCLPSDFCVNSTVGHWWRLASGAEREGAFEPWTAGLDGP